LKFFLKKPETGSNRPVLVRFGFLGQNWFKPVWLGFFRFDSIFQVLLGFFPVWLGFFRLGSVLARFFQFVSILTRFFSGFDSIQFFQFQDYKTKPVGFFKILISFFSRFGFFGYFFSSFLGFLIFLLTTN
jgi:hypothetical protein